MTDLTSYITFLITPMLNTFPVSKLDNKILSANTATLQEKEDKPMKPYLN